MSRPHEDPAEGLGRVEGILGEITDSSTLFTIDKGQTYRDFWNEVSTTRLGANFAVVGTAFDEDPTDESLILHGQPEVQIIAHKLRVSTQSRVLEIGCGVGRLAFHMAGLCGSYVGSDISANMLAIAAENCRSRENVEFVELEETRPLPFPDSSFDAVFSQAVFIHLDREDCYRYMREAFRVLRPGGRAYFQFFNLLHFEGFKLFDWISKYAIGPQGRVRGRIQFATAPEVRAYSKAAGFAIDETRSHLGMLQQHYEHLIPTVNWDYYLILVATRPDVSDSDRAALVPEGQTCPPIRFSEEYCRRYRDTFFCKLQRHALSDRLEIVRKFLAELEPIRCFECIVTIERALLEAIEAGVEPMTIFPALYDTATEVDDPLTLVERFNRRKSAILEGRCGAG